jgi:hypothetical protein
MLFNFSYSKPYYTRNINMYVHVNFPNIVAENDIHEICTNIMPSDVTVRLYI